MQFTKLEAVKFAAQVVVGVSTGFCTNNIIKNNLEIETTSDYVKGMIGTMVISSMVVEQARVYVNRSIDESVEKYKELKAKQEEAKAAAAE